MSRPSAHMLFGISILILFGCSGIPFSPAPTPFDTPAAVPTGTSAAIPTRTPAPTVTLAPTREPAATETTAGSCLAADGVWKSEEQDFFGPILTFRVSRCGIASITVWVYVVDGELYMADSHTALLIDQDAFEYSEASGAGEFILGGIFDSSAAAHGTMKFTKGFDVFGTVLSKEVVIPWNAAPV
jgi:hypothetical protein